MRIDQDKFPALFDDNLVLKLYEHKLDPETKDIFKDVIQLAKQNITYLARPVMTPMLESYTKLIPHRKELKESTRALLFHSKSGNPHCFLYTMFPYQERIQVICQITCASDTIEGGHYGSLFSGYVDIEESETVSFRSYVGVPPLGSVEAHDNIVSETLRAILSAELFINYAEVETKEMKPNRQIWDGPKALYNNKTKYPINVIDSTWYTNLVSSGAFKVRGHFRLQPYGHGLTKRRLVWIQEFQKDGYTRRAKIETNGK